MSGTRRTGEPTPLPEEELQSEVADAATDLGWRVPRTEEEVARWEAEHEASAPALPARLADARSVWGGPRRSGLPRPTVFEDPRLPDIRSDLARAARSGRRIPEEVEEAMRRDRAAAEGAPEDGQSPQSPA